MKTILRWLKIKLTCGLGFHAPLQSEPLSSEVTVVECPRCRAAHVTRLGYRYNFHRPSAWDVARGYYDPGMHQ